MTDERVPTQPWWTRSLDRVMRLGRGRFVALYAGISYLILMTLASSVLLFGTAAVRDQVDRGLRSNAMSTASFIALSMKSRADILSAFAARPLLEQAVADGHLDPSERTLVAAFLGEIVQSIDGASNSWVTTPDGTALEIAPAEPSLVGQSFAHRDWFQGASASDGPYLSNAYVAASTGHPLVIAVATRITDANNRSLGVIGASFALDGLQEFIDAFELQGGAHIVVTDNAANIVAATGTTLTSLVRSSDPWVADALEGRIGSDDQAADTIAAYTPIHWANWALRLSVPKSEALAAVGAMSQVVIVTAALLALVNLGMVLLLYGAMRQQATAERALVRSNAELEWRVRERTAALETANHELEAFSYSVSHDLRAPLRSIDGFSKILLTDHAAQLDAEARRVLDVVTRNARQMGTLIDDLLAFSRVMRRDIERRQVDMGKLALSAADAMRVAEPGRDLEVDIRPLDPVAGDPALLSQVWANLLGNAAKFTRPVERPRIEVGSERVRGEVRFTVRDNGVGFDARYIDKLFQPFSRLHSATEFEGTGIGLAIVARIVQRHGGRVWAESIPGAGATFGFALPEKELT